MSIPDIIQNNIETLQSGAAIFSDLTDAQYKQTHAPYFSASIGKHFRHILDHYFCFFSGLDQGYINYDRRERDNAIETKRLYTLNKIIALIEQLKALSHSYSDTRIDNTGQTLKVSLSSSATNPASQPAPSSVSRELIFLQGHTTHHYAIISTQLKLMECPVDENFGIAASTQIYNQQLSCAQ